MPSRVPDFIKYGKGAVAYKGGRRQGVRELERIWSRSPELGLL
jgi:hypothetical protein